jgi:hypothetical protein
MKPIPAILIDENGDLHTLYNEAVDLRDIGRIENVHRASHVRFDEHSQEWTVVCALTGRIVHRNPSREAAIEWEIEQFQPGGEFNQQQPGALNGQEGQLPDRGPRFSRP